MAGIQVEERPVFTEPEASGHQRIQAVPEVPGTPSLAPVEQAVGRLGSAIGFHIENLVRQDQEIAVLKAKNDIATGLQGAEQRALQFSDWSQVEQSFKADSASLKATVLGSAPDQHTQLRIHAFYDESVLRASATIANNVLAKKQDEVLASGERTAAFVLKNVTADPENANGLPEGGYARNQLGDIRDSYILSGAKTQAEAEAWERSKIAQGDMNAALDAIHGPDPLKGYSLLMEKQTVNGKDEYKNFTGLERTSRETLGETALNHSLSMMRLRDAEDTRADRLNEKTVKKEQDDLAASMFDQAFRHNPNIEQMLLDKRTDLGPANFEKLVTALKSGAFGDDHDRLMLLKKDVYDDKVTGDEARNHVLLAAGSRQITDATFSALMGEISSQENKSRGAGGIVTGVQAGRKMMNLMIGMDERGLLAKFLDPQERTRAISFVGDYESWAAQNQGADVADAQKEVWRLGEKWVHEIHRDTMGALPRPTGIEWKEAGGVPQFSTMAKDNAALRKTNPALYAANLDHLTALSLAWDKTQKQTEAAKRATQQ